MRLTRAGFLGAIAAAGPLAAVARADVREDLRIVNFLLGIEYVHSALYRDALKEVPDLSPAARSIVEELRDNEIAHVDALRATLSDLGGKPDDRPRVVFGRALASESAFLKLANTLEDAGVSAYNGVIPQIESEDLVAAAASIVQVEARHSGLIRVARDKPPAPLALDKTSNEREVRSALRPFLRE
jgi:hypothetical protein